MGCCYLDEEKPEQNCYIKASHNDPGEVPRTTIAGGHLETRSRDRYWYILPICSHDNASK